MVKRSLLPGQPLSPAIPEVRRGPSRFLQVASDRSRGSQHPLRMPPLSPLAPSLSPQPLTRRRLLPGPAANHVAPQATSADISPLLAQDCLTRLCLITLRSTLDPGLLRTAMQLRCQSEVAGLRTMAPASMPWTAVQGLCQRFARNYATRDLTTPHDTTPDSASHLRGCVGTCGAVRRCEPPAHRWHARGQGFKSPQLHSHEPAGQMAFAPKSTSLAVLSARGWGMVGGQHPSR
jgi:hypothetical protein